MLARDTPDPLVNVEGRMAARPPRRRAVGRRVRPRRNLTLSREETPLVELAGLAYTYEGERGPVLEGISLKVSAGEFVLILGPSGCGKSTLLQVMNGTVPHTLRGGLEGARSSADAGGERHGDILCDGSRDGVSGSGDPDHQYSRSRRGDVRARESPSAGR